MNPAKANDSFSGVSRPLDEQQHLTSSIMDGETMNSTVLVTAEKALAAEMSVIPIRPDGRKAPALQSWKKYQERRASHAEARKWFDSTDAGLAIVGGEVSGGIEILDFDRKGLWTEYFKRSESFGIDTTVLRAANGYLESTPNGIHLMYRVTEPRNRKLAKTGGANPKDRKTLIETKGKGGYCIIAPSNGGVHPSGEPYELIRGDLSKVATLLPDEHEILLDLARSFDESESQVREKRPLFSTDSERGAQARPGDDFNRKASWAEILEPHGWTFSYATGDADYWRRPGKKQGISASTEKHPGILLVFSTSTEFTSTLENRKGYTKFAAFAVLNHRGDFSSAARELRALGYGAS